MKPLPAWLASIGIPNVGNLPLYERAMTHGSTGKPDYQRLEFLGDRVLGLAVADMLYTSYPDEPEGKLSHRLNALVSGATCADVARDLGAGPLIALGKQARSDGAAESDNVLGDVMESIIGALFLDQGIATARSFVESHWRERIALAGQAPRHPKSLLQEWAASTGKRPPVYETLSKTGPAHSRTFEVQVSVKGLEPVTATAPSKQEAETRAAKSFLEKYI